MSSGKGACSQPEDLSVIPGNHLVGGEKRCSYLCLHLYFKVSFESVWGVNKLQLPHNGLATVTNL